MPTITPFIPTEEELAEIEAMERRLQRQPQAPVPGPAPAPQASTPAPQSDWTRHLRPVDAPVPDWAKPKPPDSGETSPSSPNSPGGFTHAEPTRPEACAEDDSAEDENAPNAPNPPGGCTREHPIPEDSILADYRDFMRGFSELSDGLIIAPILSLCGRLLTPDVTLDFGGSKPLTMYNFVACPAGLRKSTTFKPAEKIAQQILMHNDLLYGNASDSALFDSFESQPHRLQFEDEGNTILRTWETSAHGREVSARYLKLYDGSPWTQNYLRERKLHEDGSAERHIPLATLSLCIGSTLGVARLDHLEAGSGLRRRFGFYLATDQERLIDWPHSLNGGGLDELAEKFRLLADLKGVVGAGSLTAEAREYWSGLQQRNRARCKQIPGYTSGDESLLSSLNESPARCLKLAVIFQACRWARGSIADPYTITEDVLALAEQHQNACLDSLIELEALSRRGEVTDTAEWLLAQISGDHPSQRTAEYTRADITRRFAGHAGRRGALTPSCLNNEIIPRLIAQGHCHRTKAGRKVTYTFHWE